MAKEIQTNANRNVKQKKKVIWMVIFLHNRLLSQIIMQHARTVTCSKKTLKEFYTVIRIYTDIGCKTVREREWPSVGSWEICLRNKKTHRVNARKGKDNLLNSQTNHFKRNFQKEQVGFYVYPGQTDPTCCHAHIFTKRKRRKKDRPAIKMQFNFLILDSCNPNGFIKTTKNNSRK